MLDEQLDVMIRLFIMAECTKVCILLHVRRRCILHVKEVYLK